MWLLVEFHNITPLVIVLMCVISVVGLALIIIAAKWISSDSATQHILRDVGLALLIAAIVSALYELNSRSIFDLDRLQGVLKTVLAANVPDNVWDQVNREILQRQVIRKNVDYRVSLQSEPALPECQRVLKMSFSYDLQSLGPNKVKYTLSNELGSLQLRNPEKDLPRFESVTVGGDVYQGDRLASLVKDGAFTIKDIELTPGVPIHVEVARTEIVYVPGNFDLALTELTDSLRIHAESTPDLKPSVKIWSDKGTVSLLPAGNMWFFNGVIFPGQEVTIRFMKTNDQQYKVAIKKETSKHV